MQPAVRTRFRWKYHIGNSRHTHFSTPLSVAIAGAHHESRSHAILPKARLRVEYVDIFVDAADTFDFAAVAGRRAAAN